MEERRRKGRLNDLHPTPQLRTWAAWQEIDPHIISIRAQASVFTRRSSSYKLGEERVIATKHICHKVVFRAQKTIQKIPTVNINAVCIFFICVGRIKLERRRREKQRPRQGDRKTFHTHFFLEFIHCLCPFFPQFIQEVHLCFTLWFHTAGSLFSHSLKGYIKKPWTGPLFCI